MFSVYFVLVSAHKGKDSHTFVALQEMPLDLPEVSSYHNASSSK